MILYLDTSALVKIYIEEDGTPIVRRAIAQAELVATSDIAYVELRAALARRHREGHITGNEYRRLGKNVATDWPQLLAIALGRPLVEDAADVAKRYNLRAYDAVHLASALLLRVQLEETVTFGCWDSNLSAAATIAKLTVFPKSEA